MPPLITPPIRTSLITQNGVPFSPENGDIQTAREWWLYWNRLGDQINLTGLQTSEGAHSDRPVPGGMPDGAIFAESDRGVIYQIQGGDWMYVAGIMYGTISPDQRPRDLGANDSGFAFTATDPLASDTGRTFTWSGTAWVETSEVLYGTHANRPVPAAAPARCLYIEADRGPMFQNQLGQWVYIAGTMWGTISPDQRPTDLGMFDAGFNFRTNVAPIREFIWSGTAWVEITALVDPTTTAGDLIARGATAPATRLPVGTNGQVLTADSAQALGVKWATPAASGSQTPWTSNIDAAAHSLGSVSNIGIGTPAPGGGELIRLIGPSTLGNAYLQFGYNGAPQCYFGYGNITATFGIVNYAAGPMVFATSNTERMRIDTGGNVSLGGAISPSHQLELSSDSASKAATSAWFVFSDPRLKENIEPVQDDSLAIVSTLDWIRFEYNGRAGTPRGTKAIGLDARALREQMPDAVRSFRAKLDDEGDEADILEIDYHHVLVHSARAIQQLSAEVARLRALIEPSAA